MGIIGEYRVIKVNIINTTTCASNKDSTELSKINKKQMKMPISIYYQKTIVRVKLIILHSASHVFETQVVMLVVYEYSTEEFY